MSFATLKKSEEGSSTVRNTNDIDDYWRWRYSGVPGRFLTRSVSFFTVICSTIASPSGSVGALPLTSALSQRQAVDAAFAKSMQRRKPTLHDTNNQRPAKSYYLILCEGIADRDLERTRAVVERARSGVVVWFATPQQILACRDLTRCNITVCNAYGGGIRSLSRNS